MITVTKNRLDIPDLVLAVCNRPIRSLFCNKDLRDEVAKHLTRAGYLVRKGSVRGQQLHPEYVTDFVGEYQTGFGNTDYLTYWSVLYTIEIKARPPG